MKQKVRRIGASAKDRKPEPPAAPPGRAVTEEIRQTLEGILKSIENAGKRTTDRPWPFTSWQRSRKG